MAHRNEKEAVKKWSLRLRSSQPPFSFLFRREENISNKKTYTLFNRDDVRRSLML